CLRDRQHGAGHRRGGRRGAGATQAAAAAAGRLNLSCGPDGWGPFFMKARRGMDAPSDYPWSACGPLDQQPMSESFAELFEQSFASQQIRPGAILKGLVVEINDDVVIVSAGLKSESVIPADQFKNEKGEWEVAVGDEVEVAL